MGNAITDRFKGRIFFTMGCHAGESIDDALTANPALTHDWAQSYAQGDAAIFIANTGYGYGDTASVALSERLLAIFAGHLGFTGTVGEKFVQSKNEYFATMGAYGPYDEKALEELTYYGLPFWTVNSPTEPAPTPPAIDGTDPATGYATASLTLSPTLTETADGRGVFWTANGGSVFVQGHSVQPLQTADVTQPTAVVAHGFWPTSLISEDHHDLNLYFARPMIDQSGHEPEPVVTNETFPASPLKMTQVDYLGRRHSTLQFIAGQSRDGTTPSTETERLFTNVAGVVTYAPASVTDYVAPRFQQGGAIVSGGNATIFATVTDESTAGVKRVEAFFTTGGPWTFVQLTHGAGNLWSVTVPTSALKIEVGFVSEDAGGNTGWMTAKGDLLESVTPSSVVPTIRIDRPTDGASYTLGQSVPSSYTCSSSAAITDCTGTVTNGTPISTSSVGTKTFTVNATAVGGTTKTKTASYSVLYDSGGFSSVKTTATAGSTIPITFTLHGNFGTNVFGAAPTSGSIPCTGGTVVKGDPALSPGNSGAQYVSSTNSYQWNWKTDKSYTGCRQLVLTLADGSVHRLTFQFSK
jgi:hypothetical protein